MSNKSWLFLKPGDIVDIIAPSSNVPGENLEQYYQQTQEIFASLDLVARIPEDLIIPGKDLFSTNSLEYRANHLIDALTNNSSKAVWGIRGGYGAAKLIPFLEKIPIPEQEKLLLGFSDITALHLFLQHQWHWHTMHAPVINQLINNYSLLTELKPLLFGQQSEVKYNQITPLNRAAQADITIQTEITGGNLSLIQTSLATAWQIKPENKIIFLEEVGERGYRIDRMLNHLLQAGIFAHAKAIIFGEITPEFEKDTKELCTLAIETFAKTLSIPAVSLPIIGHNPKCNSPLPLGTKCILELGKKPLLTCNIN
jgi:muramoyltetrapeptide carboxypeptidase